MTVKPIIAYVPNNYNSTAAVGAWVSCKNYQKVQITIKTGPWAGGTAAVTLSQAKDVSGTSAKTLGFEKVWTNKGGTSSASLVETDVTNNTFNLDTANAMWVIVVDVSSLDTTNGFDCLRVNVASPGANNDHHEADYILIGAGYLEDFTLNQRAN